MDEWACQRQNKINIVSQALSDTCCQAQLVQVLDQPVTTERPYGVVFPALFSPFQGPSKILYDIFMKKKSRPIFPRVEEAFNLLPWVWDLWLSDRMFPLCPWPLPACRPRRRWTGSRRVPHLPAAVHPLGAWRPLRNELRPRDCDLCPWGRGRSGDGPRGRQVLDGGPSRTKSQPRIGGFSGRKMEDLV